MRIAFAAESRARVDAFHAFKAGAKDNGSLGARYHPGHYRAFAIGPDGHDIEAVCRRTET
ncbi:MAG: hypothetical protein LBU11_00145 [Zoogloeaceae bacterium]|jgi:hypothetical protein|nr:hypothetical protein [Zoogloeaceae bacterium]